MFPSRQQCADGTSVAAVGHVVGVVPLRSLPIVPPEVAASAPARAAGSFLLVAVVGALVRRRRSELLGRAVDATLARPARAPVYGAAATALGGIVVVYGLSRASLLGSAVGAAAAEFGTAAVLGVGGFGFVVVGTGILTVVDERRAWAGPLAGGGLSALVWLALPALPALLVWVFIAATGVGGSARRWFHASASVERGGEK